MIKGKLMKSVRVHFPILFIALMLLPSLSYGGLEFHPGNLPTVDKNTSITLNLDDNSTGTPSFKCALITK